MTDSQPKSKPEVLTVEGTTQSMEEWAADYGIPVSLIETRLNNGWSTERAITEPMLAQPGERLPAHAFKRPYVAQTYKHGGIELTVRQWADRLGISVQAMHARLQRNTGPRAFIPKQCRTRPPRG